MKIYDFTLVFQFTHPGKGATYAFLNQMPSACMFQFTHPGKGATLRWKRPKEPHSEFQFTHPGKGATGAPGAPFCFSRFQFTHPGKGATLSKSLLISRYCVSIHAPWEGCDASSFASFTLVRCFNSRTLGRVRLNAGFNPLKELQFQFTHPGKGATPHPLHP